MTPAEHIAEAERLLLLAQDGDVQSLPLSVSSTLQLALTHAVIAAAVELGVPHAPTSTPAVTSG
jgi:hypothetical protein